MPSDGLRDPSLNPRPAGPPFVPFLVDQGRGAHDPFHLVRIATAPEDQQRGQGQDRLAASGVAPGVPLVEQPAELPGLSTPPDPRDGLFVRQQPQGGGGTPGPSPPLPLSASYRLTFDPLREHAVIEGVKLGLSVLDPRRKPG